MARVRDSWTSWRGRAIEPFVREALARILSDDRLSAAPAVGGYWTRTNDPEIDIVGADRAPIAKQITTVGSIKWHDNRPFDTHDLAHLMIHRSRLPGADDNTPLVAVTRAGTTTHDIPTLGPDDLINTWQA